MRNCSHVEVLYSDHQSQDYNKVYIMFRFRFVYVELLRLPAQKAGSASKTGSLGTQRPREINSAVHTRSVRGGGGRLGLALIDSANKILDDSYVTS
jgi:hypothetical protein